ncbi:TolC family protein [Marinoscillum sp. MHG1-6]|uniref:TolC family protein n=1 Tax=Marinoscillum sp. MHG1-6 TaxID=2959627 RepID=UPI002157C283|nr:TolC family protein [Marinoscillum sp. MHG1-6]
MENSNLKIGSWKLEVEAQRLAMGKRSVISQFYLLISIYICSLIIPTGSKAQTLADYQRISAENNPELQAKYKELEAAMERIPQVNSLPDPTLSLGYFISPVETRVGPQRLRISLSQMFPWFGTLKASGDVATLNAEAQYQVFLDAKNKVYFKVAAAYYPLYELAQWKQLEQENIELLASYKTIATSKFKNGEGTLVDVLRVDLMLKEGETNLEILNRKKKPLLIAFNQLLNRDDDAEVEVVDSLDFNRVFVSRDSLLNDNPYLEELDLRISSSEKRSLLAEKQGLPKIGFGLDYVLVGERKGVALNDNGKDILMPMVSVSLPIYRAKYRAAKKEAEYIRDSYALQKEARINELSTGYEMTYFEIDQQADLISLYDEQITETQQVLNLMLAAYGNSGKDFEEVLRTQQQLLKYQKMKASALVNYHVAQAKLNYLMGK